MNTITSAETPAERVAHVVLDYYRQTEGLAEAVTNLERMDWYTALSQIGKDELQQLQPTRWIELPAFKRYLLEKRGLSMHRYVALHLTPAELTHWVDDGDGSVRPE
jgi:hypothetical protein